MKSSLAISLVNVELVFDVSEAAQELVCSLIISTPIDGVKYRL
jgi:hypothetical protein